MTFLLITVSVILFFCIRLLDAIKSGCFYAAKRKEGTPDLLKKYYDNIHRVQTPFWYCVFVGFGILLFALLNNTTNAIYIYCWGVEINWIKTIDILITSYLISAGTSAMCGPFYQGYINVGCGLPFVDENENHRMELVLGNEKRMIKRFWYGKRRIYLAFAGLLEVVIGLVIVFIIQSGGSNGS